MVCRFTWVQLGFLGMVVCTWEAGRPSPAWSTLGPLCSQKWWARKRPAALAANHGLIFKFVAQDPRIRTHHSVGTKTDRGMIWLILGFLLTNGPWLLFFALFEYKPGWVQHEGPSLLLFYIGTVARIQSGGSHYAPHIAAQQLCAGCAPLWPDVVAEDLWQKCAYSKITVTPLPPLLHLHFLLPFKCGSAKI